MNQVVFNMPFKTFSACLKTLKGLVEKDAYITIITDPNGDVYFLHKDEYEIKLKTSATVEEVVSESFRLSDLLSIKGNNKCNIEFSEHDELTFKVDTLGTSFVEYFPSILTADTVCPKQEYSIISAERINNFAKIIMSKDIQEWFIYNNMKYVKYGKNAISYLSPIFSAYTKIQDNEETYDIPVKLIKSGLFKKDCDIYKNGNTYQINQEDVLFVKYEVTTGKPIEYPKLTFNYEISLNPNKLFDALLNVSSFKECVVSFSDKMECGISAGEKTASITYLNEGQKPINFTASVDLFTRATTFLIKDENSLIKMKLFSENNVVKYVCLNNGESSVMMSCLK